MRTQVMLIESPTRATTGERCDFSNHGIDLLPYSDGTAALLDLTTRRPDVVVAPTDMVGVDLLRFVDAVTTWASVPVIVSLDTTGAASELAFSALRAGAKGLLPVPFTAKQLATALLHVTGVSVRYSAVVEVGEVMLDPQAHRVTHAGTEIPFSPRDFQILSRLLSEAPRVVCVDELVRDGRATGATENGVRTAIMRIRRRLEKAHPSGTSPILTVPGIGYRIAEPATTS